MSTDTNSMNAKASIVAAIRTTASSSKPNWAWRPCSGCFRVHHRGISSRAVGNGFRSTPIWRMAGATVGGDTTSMPFTKAQLNAPECAPHQAHFQGLDFNALNGGIMRWFEPIKPDMATVDALQRFL